MVTFFMLPGSVTAENDSVPISLDGATVVAAEQVRGLVGKARLIDTRILHDYLAGHLPGAVHIHYKERSARSAGFDPALDDIPAFVARLRKFAPERDTPLVFYCNGISCWKSYKGAYAALNNGYRRVYWFRGGMGEWQKRRFEIVSE
jgi:rhodanese-related sulfurtransferase